MPSSRRSRWFSTSRAERPGVDPGALRDRLAQGGAEGLRGREDPLDVHVEPAVDGLLDEIAPHEEHEHGRGDGHDQEDEQEPQAKAGPEHPPPPLQEHANQVAPEDEDQGQEQEEVQDGEAVEQDRGQEVGREVAALAQQDLDPDEQTEGHGRHQEDETRVVTELGARHRAFGL